MDEMSFKEKIRTLNFGTRGRTRPKVEEGRDAQGYKTKAVTGEHGHTVTEHANPQDQVDVHIRAPHIRMSSREVPHNGG